MLNFVTYFFVNNSNFKSSLSFLAHSLQQLPESVIHAANVHNQWFTPAFISLAANNWVATLNENDIEEWLKPIQKNIEPKKVAIIMAGNLPFVGLHDLICVLATGNKALVKLSSQDEVLMKYAIEKLIESDTTLKDKIEITERLNDAEKLIATGSNNSARYFDYYFRNIPTLIRKNRTSIAVLSGNETEQELQQLANDIYQYFGLGCRNVSHLLMPKNMDLEKLYKALDIHIDLVHHHKFYNNYMYHKAILLMNLTKHYDNGFMIFQEKEELHAPIATLNYHYYDTIEDVKNYITTHKDNIQCVASNILEIKNVVELGSTQKPSLWHYADNVNTIDFLIS